MIQAQAPVKHERLGHSNTLSIVLSVVRCTPDVTSRKCAFLYAYAQKAHWSDSQPSDSSRGGLLQSQGQTQDPYPPFACGPAGITDCNSILVQCLISTKDCHSHVQTTVITCAVKSFRVSYN